MTDAALLSTSLPRRALLRGLGASAMGALSLAELSFAKDAGSTPGVTRLAAVWRDGASAMAQDWAGVLEVLPQSGGGHAWRIAARTELPTRGHGVQTLPGGQLVFAARRPGDWLLRWQPKTGALQWAWMQEDRCFNGHVALAGPATAQAWQAQASAGGSGMLFTTETDLEDSQGCIGLRDATSLEKLAEWRSHGMDPHELLVLPAALGKLPAGTLVVANGGIPTQSETGRSKKWLDSMDPSLVTLHPFDGRLLGQWKLPDPRLSIRHLAWDAARQRLGIALQAEHEDARRQSAPIFAVWDGQRLQLAQDQPPLAGYGGSVECAPLAQGGFVVSCPKSDCMAWFDAQARYLGSSPQGDVCPVALDGARLWAGGGHGVTERSSRSREQAVAALNTVTGLMFDNHWRLVG